MAKFCTKCGSELKDGKCPKCKEETTNEVVTSEAVDVKQSFMDCLEIIKGIFTKPIKTVKKFVTENAFVSGIIMIVATALATGLYKFASLKSMYSSKTGSGFNADDLGSLFTAALSGDVSSFKEPDYFKEFMTTFAYSLVEYALIAVIGYVIITKLFKGNTSIKKMVSMVGVALAVVLCANLVNSALVFIDEEVVGYIRSYIFSIGSIFSFLVLYEGVKETSGIDKEKMFISVASMSVLATVAIDIIHKIFS